MDELGLSHDSDVHTSTQRQTEPLFLQIASRVRAAIVNGHVAAGGGYRRRGRWRRSGGGARDAWIRAYALLAGEGASTRWARPAPVVSGARADRGGGAYAVHVSRWRRTGERGRGRCHSRWVCGLWTNSLGNFGPI